MIAPPVDCQGQEAAAGQQADLRLPRSTGLAGELAGDELVPQTTSLVKNPSELAGDKLVFREGRD